MNNKYAQVILDITSGNLDRPFQYRIPENIVDKVMPGVQVIVPLGVSNRQVKAFVIEIGDKPLCDLEKIKNIISICEDTENIEALLIKLALWMKKQYGATMAQCLKTVLPVAKKAKTADKKDILRAVNKDEYDKFLYECRKKHQYARIRLLEAVPENGAMPYELASKIHVNSAVIRSLLQKGIIKVKVRDKELVTGFKMLKKDKINPNEYQLRAINEIKKELFKEKDKKPCLLKGITGSGKTLVYMELIELMVKEGKQTILLIPEIALTYQTVMRFYERFGNRVSFINSRLSSGERYEQFLRAKEGKIDIMIGPRSAVFTPFLNLGLIIIDEEHESAYKSETTPRYHTREVAMARASMCNAQLILGSATPSVESAYRAVRGEYRLVEINQRAVSNAVLPKVHIVDMRKELISGNKTMFSRFLYEKIKERLERGEQTMLFLNRRGYENFVSCRSCGEAVKCPHCDVSLTYHRNGMLKCHYCGYIIPMIKKCPTCGSPYVAGFGTGTQKVEEKLKELFPKVRILRMDMDTTKGKNGHEKILSSFANKEADILVGTQMIVKGHDFENVTLVGALAADTSLYANSFTSCERTFQLLTQAAGRAGRGNLLGEMVIQTYKPEHYSIQTAATQNYVDFYKEEISYRKAMRYPPCVCLTEVIFSSRTEENVKVLSEKTANAVRKNMGKNMGQILGPQPCNISKINDIYYYHMYIRTLERKYMNEQLLFINSFMEWTKDKKDVIIQFDIS